MVFNLTPTEYTALLKKAIYNEAQFGDQNKSKFIRGYRNTIDRLSHASANVPLVVESANGRRKSRSFDIPNIGSLVECLVRMSLDKIPATAYSKEFNDAKADLTIGWCAYEVKASMGAVSLNTPINGERPVLFVNELGVFSIRKDEIENYTDKYGRLPYNKPVGKYWKSLSAKLGYDTDTAIEGDE